MSGAEVAGLFFGVLPVVIDAVKAYHTTCEKIRIFQHYSREVERIQKQFRVRQRMFLNECHLLLQLVVDDDVTKAMLGNFEHSLWRDKNLDNQLNNYLSDSYQSCKDIVEDTQTILEDVGEELRCFDAIASEKLEGESLKRAVRRLRDSIVISFKKESYEASLARLRDRNADLSHLRSQIGEFQRKRIFTQSCIARKSLPSSYSMVQTASHKLHEAFSTAWCCSDAAHSAHFAKLCLEAQVEDTVRLDLAISYKQTQGKGESVRSDTEQPPFWLYVQSTSVNSERLNIPSTENLYKSEFSRELSHALHDPQTAPQIHESVGATVNSSVYGSLKKKVLKRRKVRSTNDFSTAVGGDFSIHQTSTNSLSHTKTPNADEANVVNLCKITNFCQHLRQKFYSSDHYGTNNCIGYLENPNVFRHVLYSADRKAIDIGTQRVHNQEIITLEHLLQCTHNGKVVLGPVLRLKLALRIATAVLQFHSTPWLNQEWRLKHLSFFGTFDDLSDKTLQTLHLSAQFPENASGRSAAPTEGIEPSECFLPALQLQKTKLQYGINNSTLFCLGIALLELGYIKPLEAFCEEQAQDPIFTARKLAESDHPLGLRYQRIVQRCLQCNFGFGTDLSKKELQSAVYGDVVCHLEEMIHSLTLE